MSETESAWLGFGLFVAACYGYHEHSRAKALELQVNDLKVKTEALTAASDNLKEQIGRFETENWRDVVPDAKDAADEVDTAKEDLQSSASSADGSDSE